MSQDKKTKPKTASELFKNSDKRHSKDEDFFDSLGSSSGQLERPTSELCLAQYQDGSVSSDVLQHSSSQNDLATIQNQQQHNTHLHSQMYPAHLTQNTESMQSITLSRDSLLAEPQNVSIDLGAQNNIPVPVTVESLAPTIQQQKQNFTVPSLVQQPLQQQQQLTQQPPPLSQHQNQIITQQHQELQQQLIQQKQSQQVQQSQQQQVEFNTDHMKSFDNPALALEVESLGTLSLQNQVFPEQPATVQNTLPNQTQVSKSSCSHFVY